MKRAIVIGATSGIGKEVARILAAKGWKVGIAGRRESLLKQLKESDPESFEYEVLDVTSEDAPDRLASLISKTGGMDL
jgi:NADP-dependent 3-hydroxy acid dehydrogenase YdfG